jgi:hypothetical protein
VKTVLELNDLEKDDLKRLGEACTRVMGNFKNDEARSLHVPHGVCVFVQSFFHEVFSGVLAEHAAAAMAGEDAVDDEEDSTVVINMEPLIMKAFEMMVMVGIEVGRQQHGPEECHCIENVGDAVEEALRGECEH